MRTVTIKSSGLGRYDDVSPFLVESGSLELKIELPQKSGEFYLVTESNGKNGGAQFIPRGGTVTLSGLKAGELKAEVKHYLHGEFLERFKIEPLLLKAVDTGLSAMPEIVLLTGETAALKKETDRLTERLTSAEKRADGAKNAIAELYAFAYFVYRNSPLLNGKGLSFEAFLNALKHEHFQEEL